jgi:FkbH-like protein
VNFLAARKILETFSGGTPLPFTLAMSGTPDPLLLYLKAHAAAKGLNVIIETPPFGTLQQYLLQRGQSGETSVLLFFPWDLAGECDWRSGIPKETRLLEEILAEAEQIAVRMAKRAQNFIYVPAPLPPLGPNPADNDYLAASLLALAKRLGAVIMPADTFALGSTLMSGNAIAGSKLSDVAERIIDSLTKPATGTKKVVVSDLDNVMWGGVIGEDGIEGLHTQPEGRGWPHFLYQGMLRKLKAEGALLAVVSRNDPKDAKLPFAQDDMLLKLDDFVAVMASYNAKSSQIGEIARQLDLGLDSFVFVDDNPVEIAEVSAALPQVTCLTFPKSEAELPKLFDELQSLFGRKQVTHEDRERTSLYKRRVEGMAPSDVSGADLEKFLKTLDMRLEIHDRTKGGRERAVQLINKTNQFNLNGRRWEDQEVDRVLSEGGSLFTATLGDRTGSHGEILSCLISAEGVIECFVMSCRVLQRRVEHAFLAWLAQGPVAPRGLRYAPTDRNEPLRNFIKEFTGNALPQTEEMLVFPDVAASDKFQDALKIMDVKAAS